jgi:AraC-like DNA-binding protein
MSGDRRFDLGPGQMFLIYPNTKIYYEADMIDPWHYSWIAFDGLNSEMFLTRAGFTTEKPVIYFDKRQEVEYYISKILAASESEDNRDIKLTGLLYLFLSSVISKAGNGQHANRSNYYVEEAIKFIQMNYSMDISVSQISAHLSLERKYFSRVFKEQTGVSPHEFLTNYRLKKACMLMYGSTLNIGEIATSVGYPDQLSFSRLFKKHFGVTPSSYRSRIKLAPGRQEKDKQPEAAEVPVNV